MERKEHWTLAEGIEALPEHAKERLFDLVVGGVLILDPEATGVLADWAYPPDEERV